MEELKQIILQNNLNESGKVAHAFKLDTPSVTERNLVNYDDLTQAEKDQWDAFYEMIKSKV